MNVALEVATNREHYKTIRNPGQTVHQVSLMDYQTSRNLDQYRNFTIVSSRPQSGAGFLVTNQRLHGLKLCIKNQASRIYLVLTGEQYLKQEE